MSANLRKKALFPAISMVMASVIALSGVSYAWFTMGNNADLGKLDVEVQVATGMQISMDAVNWKSTLTTDDIKGDLSAAYSGNVNQFPTINMSPVSTDGSVDSGRLNMFLGTIKPDGTLSAAKETDAKGTSGNYIAFDVFFNMAMDKTIYLDTGSKVEYAGSTDTKTQLASRVGFVNLGNTTGSPVDAQNLQGSGVSEASSIWEPNATDHTDYAIAYYGAGGKEGYKGVSSAGDPAGLSSGDVSTKSPSTFATGEEAKILSLKKGVNKVRIYIWVEGQDIDCNNDISVGGISTTIKFVQDGASSAP